MFRNLLMFKFCQSGNPEEFRLTDENLKRKFDYEIKYGVHLCYECLWQRLFPGRNEKQINLKLIRR